MLKKTLLFVVFIGLHAHAEDFSKKIHLDVAKFQLENGMTVLLHEDHSAPIVSIHQWYRVGSRHEKEGRTGLAHFFEHLMFKGTNKVSGKQLEEVIQKNGGENNAFTSRDYTGYYANMPSDKLEVILKIESDRMRNLLFKPEELKSEIEVVKEERRYRVENSVKGSLYEALFKTAFKISPYRWPVVGYMRDLNAASKEDLKDFYGKFYSPNNSVLTIAGDFKTEDVKSLVNKYYGQLKRQDLPAVSFVKEPEQNGIRHTTLKKNVQNVTVAIAYKTPPSGSKESYALDLLGLILGSGDSSRLYKKLVYKNDLASSTYAGAYSMQKEGLFLVYSSLKPGKSLRPAKKLMFAEIKKLRRYLVSEKELEKAKNQVMKSYVDNLKTISGKAQALALNEILFSDYRIMFNDLGMYMKVTREDLMDVSRKYLLKKRSSVVDILPKKEAK